METQALVHFVAASLLITITPGPDILYVLASSLRSGFKTGIFIALGLCSGLIIHTSLVGFGAAQLIQQSLLWTSIFKIFGVSYMLWLAYKVYQSDSKLVIQKVIQDKNGFGGYFAQGFLMNLLNPKVSMFFLAFLPHFIHADSGNITEQAFVLGGIFFIQALLVFSLVAFLSGKIHKLIDGNLKINHWMNVFQIVLFVFIALSILLI